MEWIERKILYLAWIISIIGTLGSLYFSEIRRFAPCTLCWYQRIFLYPPVILIAVGILRRDKGLPLYILPLSILGVIVALYHVLLERGIVPEKLGSCTLGVSCTTKYVSYFGFVTIPFLSLATFLLITICMLLYKRSFKK